MFQELLKTLSSEVGAKAVHVMAYSMGARTLLEALRLAGPNHPFPASELTSHIYFMAPDVAAHVFASVAQAFSLNAFRRYGGEVAGTGSQALPSTDGATPDVTAGDEVQESQMGGQAAELETDLRREEGTGRKESGKGTTGQPVVKHPLKLLEEVKSAAGAVTLTTAWDSSSASGSSSSATTSSSTSASPNNSDIATVISDGSWNRHSTASSSSGEGSSNVQLATSAPPRSRIRDNNSPPSHTESSHDSVAAHLQSIVDRLADAWSMGGESTSGWQAVREAWRATRSTVESRTRALLPVRGHDGNVNNDAAYNGSVGQVRQDDGNPAVCCGQADGSASLRGNSLAAPRLDGSVPEENGFKLVAGGRNESKPSSAAGSPPARAGCAPRIHLYTARNDIALLLSELMDVGAPQIRAGRGTDDFLLCHSDAFTTVDVTELKSGLLTTGHFYLFHKIVRADIQHVLSGQSDVPWWRQTVPWQGPMVGQQGGVGDGAPGGGLANGVSSYYLRLRASIPQAAAAVASAATAVERDPGRGVVACLADKILVSWKSSVIRVVLQCFPMMNTSFLLLHVFSIFFLAGIIISDLLDKCMNKWRLCLCMRRPYSFTIGFGPQHVLSFFKCGYLCLAYSATKYLRFHSCIICFE